MNIFFLDENKELCAQYHNDKHIVKMPTQTAEILSTALYNITKIISPYVSAKYLQHGCVKWAAESIQNFLWLTELGLCLCDEFSYRHGNKGHPAKSVILQCVGYGLSNKDKFIDQNKLTTPFLAVPEECKCYAARDFFENTIASYRYYYCKYKRHLATWTRRNPPHWFN